MIETASTYILDANILMRLAEPAHPQYSLALNATKALRTLGVELRTVPQSLFEFWVVATRPLAQNGLGLTAVEAETFVDYFTRAYWPIPDDPTLLTNWRLLVGRYNVVGKRAHDARYVASMQGHGLTHILTFDADFNRYALEGIVAAHPDAVQAAADPSNP